MKIIGARDKGQGSRVVFLVFALLFLTSFSVYAEEEIGLVQKLWRKLFKKQTTAVEKAKQPPAALAPAPIEKKNTDEKKLSEEEETEELSDEELEEINVIAGEVEKDRRQQEMLEDIKRVRASEEARQQPSHPPR